MRKALLFISLIALLAMPLAASAGTVSWIYDGNGNWIDGIRWDSGVAPATGDDVSFSLTPTNSPLVVAFANHAGDGGSQDLYGLTVNSLSVSGGTYFFDYANNAIMTLESGSLSVASGANLISGNTSPTPADRFQFNIPSTVTSATWDIAGNAIVGGIRGGAAGSTTWTKTGAGTLTFTCTNTYSTYRGTYAGTINIAEGTMQWNATTWGANIYGVNVTPGTGVSSDVSFTGTGTLMLAANQSLSMTGTATAKSVLSPAGSGMGTLTIKSSSTGGVVMGNDSILSLNVNNSGGSDLLSITGTLSLSGTSSLMLDSAGLGLGGAYTLATATGGITGNFGSVYFDGNLIADPLAAGAFGNGYTLVMNPNSIALASATYKLWTGAVDNSMANSGNWSSALANDGTDDLNFTNDGVAHTLTMDGDINAASITIPGRYAITSGSTPSTLTLTKGTITADVGGSDYAKYPNFADVTIQVGDGVTAVNNAVWTFNNTGSTQLRSAQIGVVKGIEGTNVAITGNNKVRFGATSDDFLGTYSIQTANVLLDANNAMGKGTVSVDATATLRFNYNADDAKGQDATSYDNAWVANSNVTMYAAANTVATLNGDISGAGNLTVDGSSGQMIFAGDSTRTGTFMQAAVGSVVEVNGAWTDSGDITIREGTFQGTGTIGMAAGKVMSVTDSYWSSGPAYVAPGTVGTVGTMTVGTVGNSNVVMFRDGAQGDSQLLIDVIGTESDLLAINGQLDLNYDNVLDITGSLDEMTTYTLISYETISGVTVDDIFTPYMFKSVLFNGVAVGDPLAGGAFGTTHSLVYGENALELVALNAGPEYLPGDCNKDLFIDGGDLATLGLNWSPGGTGKTWEEGDFNGDGAVDGGDLAALGLNWAPGGYNVPEPTTIALLSIGGLALIRRRRK